MKSKALERIFTGPGGYALAIGVAGVVIYLLWNKAAAAGKAAADTVGGVVSGNNAITDGTVYQGGGLAGTVGAATNAASGGVLEKFGTWLGGSIYDWTHPDTTSRTQLTADNYRNIDPLFYGVSPP